MNKSEITTQESKIAHSQVKAVNATKRAQKENIAKVKADPEAAMQRIFG